MAFDKTPTTTFASYQYADSEVQIPIAALPELTADEANATTGDIREIIYSIVEKAYQAQQALDAADRSARLTIRRSTSINQDTDAVTRTYTLTFTRDTEGTAMADE